MERMRRAAMPTFADFSGLVLLTDRKKHVCEYWTLSKNAKTNFIETDNFMYFVCPSLELV